MAALTQLDKVSILAEALPYMQKFAGKTIVVKYGGAAMKDPTLKAGVITDLVLLWTVGIRPVLVHGGGPEINSWLTKLGIEPEFKNGLRVTDGARGARAVAFSRSDLFYSASYSAADKLLLRWHPCSNLGGRGRAQQRLATSTAASFASTPLSSPPPRHPLTSALLPLPPPPGPPSQAPPWRSLRWCWAAA